MSPPADRRDSQRGPSQAWGPRSRRRFLGGLAAALSGALTPGCARRSGGPPARARPEPPRLRPLAPVQVSPEALIRQVVGHRPYRPSGFVLRAEKLDDKLVVHNYGHGGGWFSLSWGSSRLALEIARESPHRRTAVIGCGALGLSNARLLQEAGFDVTLYARATCHRTRPPRWRAASGIP